jgi:nucleoside-diphosphate-sugar epimerase
MARVLVTGASGFIGRHLCRALVERGDEVTALVRPGSARGALEALGCRFAEGDMMRPDTLNVAGSDLVFHLAGMLKVPWKPAFRTVNVEGARHIAAACAQATSAPILILVSSLAAAGPSSDDQPRDETQPPQPVSIYGRVKLAAEEAVGAFADVVPTSVARPPMVFGEADRGTLPLFRSAARGWSFTPAGAKRRVSLIHAADLARALIAIADKGQRLAPEDPASGVYFTADPDPVTLSELTMMMAEAAGRSQVRTVAVPRALLWCAAAAGELYGRAADRPAVFNLDKYREVTAGSWICATDKLHALGFAGEPLADRLAQTVQWYREHGWLRDTT